MLEKVQTKINCIQFSSEIYTIIIGKVVAIVAKAL